MIVQGDWVIREWRVVWFTSHGKIREGEPEDYQRAQTRLGYAEANATIEHPAYLQERQFIPDDQCWGEWVTIIKSEGEPE